MTISKAQEKLMQHTKERRLNIGLTQAGLAQRAGVSLPSLRKFEQKGSISLESFLKLLMVLGGVEDMINAIKPEEASFLSIDDVLQDSKKKTPKKGWRE